jgi:hypothetical protein
MLLVASAAGNQSAPTDVRGPTHVNRRAATYPLSRTRSQTTRRESGDHLHEAEVLARRLGDQHRLARIATFMVIQCLRIGDYDEAVRFGQEGLSIARTLGDLSIEVVATSNLGITHIAKGEFSDAVSFFERNVALEGDLRYERFGAPPSSGRSREPTSLTCSPSSAGRRGHRTRRGRRADR